MLDDLQSGMLHCRRVRRFLDLLFIELLQCELSHLCTLIDSEFPAIDPDELQVAVVSAAKQALQDLERLIAVRVGFTGQ